RSETRAHFRTRPSALTALPTSPPEAPIPCHSPPPPKSQPSPTSPATTARALHPTAALRSDNDQDAILQSGSRRHSLRTPPGCERRRTHPLRPAPRRILLLAPARRAARGAPRPSPIALRHAHSRSSGPSP